MAIITVLVIAVGWRAYDGLYRARPAPVFDSDEEHFLYGSIGAEDREGIPYWVWLVLPRVFPDLLPAPGGYSTLGLVNQDGRDMPVGLSKLTIGYPRIAANCAFCHTASLRTSPADIPRLVPGAPAHQLDVQEYRRFLSSAALDGRFTAGTILGEISRNTPLSMTERLLYRFVIIPGARRQLRELADSAIGVGSFWGRGRADLLSVLRRRRLGQRPDTTTSIADTPPLWNLAARAERGLFWDGLNVSLRDAIVTSALEAGSSRPSLDRAFDTWEDAGDRPSLRRVHDYLGTLKPPAYPFPVDAALAASGRDVFGRACASCHAPGGARTGAVIPVAETGTDPARLDAWTDRATADADAFSARRAWAVAPYRRTGGYVASPLDGVWIRAPYLHNGSVPSLRDLLEPASSRPSMFWRGYDVFDPANVGFISDGAEAQRSGTPLDTTRPGNSNAGHEYGVALSPEDKRSLIEYLKTL
jgi:mono/diheme cytochrome c family protein